MKELIQPFGTETKTQKRVLVAFWAITVFLIWQYIPGFLIPRPLGTYNQFMRLYDFGLVEEVWASLWVIIRASAYAFPIGCLLAYGYTIPLFKPIILATSTLRNIGMNALVAAFLMMSLVGDPLKVFTMAFVMVVYFLTSLIQRLNTIDQDELDHAVSMRMSSWQTLWHRVVRGQFPYFCFDFIPCLGMAWSMLSFVEGLARSGGGLGELLLQVDKISSYNGILAIAIVAGALGFGMWYLLQYAVWLAFPFVKKVG